MVKESGMHVCPLQRLAQPVEVRAHAYTLDALDRCGLHKC